MAEPIPCGTERRHSIPGSTEYPEIQPTEATAMNENKGLIFEIEGTPRRKGMFKKLRSHISVSGIGVRIELSGNIYTYSLDDIFDVYVKEPVVDGVDSRTTVIEFYIEGKPNFFELGDDTFPGLSDKMERVLKNEWAHLLKKRDYPKTVKWFTACCAVVEISSEQNPYIFGGRYKDAETINAQREELLASWNFDNAFALKRMLPKLMNGRSVSQWRNVADASDSPDADARALFEEIKRAGGERCFWAWDFHRLIHISSLGYVCDWLSYEEALSWCLQAGLKLQKLFGGWDEFMRCYLLGYCFWAEEDPDDGDSETAARRRIYEHYKKLHASPWSVAWNLPLKREWGDSSAAVNETHTKLPADFSFLTEMYADRYYPDFLVDKLRDLLKEIVCFIEEGGHTIQEIQVILDCVIQKVNELQDEFEDHGSEIETVAGDSIGTTVAKILNYFGADIDIETAVRMREW